MLTVSNLFNVSSQVIDVTSLSHRHGLGRVGNVGSGGRLESMGSVGSGGRLESMGSVGSGGRLESVGRVDCMGFVGEPLSSLHFKRNCETAEASFYNTSSPPGPRG
jgi:hypothetical protein